MTDGPSEQLEGGNMGSVVRLGSSVVREAGEWTPAVHGLLRHLHAEGVRGIPRPLSLVPGRQETLSFVEGTVPAYPMPAWVWSESALDSAAGLLRQVHDATAGADLAGPWRSPAHDPAEVICHNDFAPYNLVFAAHRVVGVIDWDFASPGPRLWDLAYLAYRMVPLSTADWGDGFESDARRERLRRLMNGYGTEAEPQELLTVLEERLHELARFSDTTARLLGKPELTRHAALYRHDAARVQAP